MAVMEFEKTRGFRIAAVATGLVLALVATVIVVHNRQQQAAMTHVRIAGGGFLFYYRLGEVRAGVTAIVQKPTPSQSRLVAEFENPAGGAPVTVETRIRHGEMRYGLETPPLSGVLKGQPYTVTVKLYEYGGTKPLEIHETVLTSELDQEASPEGPLTIGPGYHRPAPAE